MGTTEGNATCSSGGRSCWSFWTAGAGARSKPTTPSRQAKKPNFDRLWQTGPARLLRTSGRDVGLPEGQMGNSEVGHLNIGAGRVVMQELARIGDAIADGEHRPRAGPREPDQKAQSAAAAPAICSAWFRRAACIRTRNTAAALARSLADAGVPTPSMRSPTAAIRRRNPPARTSSMILAALPPSGAARDDRRPLLRHGSRQTLGPRAAGLRRHRRSRRRRTLPTRRAVIADAHANKKFDEFILPAVVDDYRGMQDGDGVLCFNFRADRVREILAACSTRLSTASPRKRVVTSPPRSA